MDFVCVGLSKVSSIAYSRGEMETAEVQHVQFQGAVPRGLTDKPRYDVESPEVVLEGRLNRLIAE